MSTHGNDDRGAAPRARSSEPAPEPAGQFEALQLESARAMAENESLRVGCAFPGVPRRLCQAIDHLLEGCMIIDPDWRYLYVNPVAAQYGQQRPENLIGRTMLEMYPGVEATPIFAAYRRCMEQRDPLRFESPFTFADGTTKWFLFSVEPVREGIFVLSLDITERVQAEQELKRHRDHLGELVAERAAQLEQITERYRSLFSSMTEGFALQEIVCNDQGLPIDYRFLDINPAFERLTGLRRADVLGQLKSRVLPDDDAPWIEICGKVALTGEPAHLEGFSTALGRHYEAFLYCPAPRQFAVLFLDISERKRLEQERERHMAAVAEANAAKDLFLSKLSHELRTPLAAMVSSVEVLRNPGASPTQHAKVLEILDRNVRHQARLMDDLLDLSRLMLGRIELVRQALDLRDVVAAQVAAAAALASNGRLSLKVEACERPVPVAGDSSRIGQVISNLLANAIKFTEPGGSIVVRTSIDQTEAQVSVVDTGIGIPPELLPRIFEPFRPGGSSSTQSRGGLGIGLAVARSLADMHGGRLEARSAGPEKGSELTLRLPLRTEQAEGPSMASAKARRSGHRRVLVVEDNADLRDTLAIMLRLLGHVAILAPTAESALELARREHPDAALVDIGLPGMDGYELAQTLRADPSTRHIRLVALTGYATEKHRARALAAGFDHHVPKPVDQDELRRLLQS